MGQSLRTCQDQVRVTHVPWTEIAHSFQTRLHHLTLFCKTEKWAPLTPEESMRKLAPQRLYLPKISAPGSVSVVSFHLCTVPPARYILHMLQVSPKHAVNA